MEDTGQGVKKNKSQISLALIATYPQMSETLIQLAEEEKVILYDINASFNEAVQEAIKIAPNVDAIISRGGTGADIQRAVDIPVISIPITPFALVETLCRHNIRNQAIAFVSYHRIVFGMGDISELFQIDITPYVFHDRNDIIRAVEDCRRKGIRTVIGGALTASLASEVGLDGIEVTSDKDTIYNAFFETIKLVKVRREEMNVAARLQVAFDALTEGIIITNEEKIVTKFNTASERILNIKSRDIEGKPFAQELLHEEFTRSFERKQPIKDRFIQAANTALMVNHLPVHLDEKFVGVVSTIQDVTKIQNLESQIRKKLVAKGFLTKYTLDDILTVNAKMFRVKELTRIYAKTMSVILIEGESGTGKEMLAQSIHMASPCASGPFIAVNCAALPRELLESELFGYEPGSFTGAKREGKNGLFELAHGGTIFLDEIGEIPIDMQASLLRVIQEKEMMRIGGNKLIPVNVRIISATNVDLKERVKQGMFRKDLYYRLSVFNIKLPPLRERKDDVPILADFFIKRYGLSDPGAVHLAAQTIATLGDYEWPGNIRELGSMVERICLLLENLNGEQETLETLLEYLNLSHGKEPDNADEVYLRVHLKNGLRESLAEAEQAIVEQALHRNNYDVGKTAKQLQVGRTTLWRKRQGEKNDSKEEHGFQ